VTTEELPDETDTKENQRSNPHNKGMSYGSAAAAALFAERKTY
jgi:hypothetical protein